MSWAVFPAVANPRQSHSVPQVTAAARSVRISHQLAVIKKYYLLLVSLENFKYLFLKKTRPNLARKVRDMNMSTMS